MCPLRRMKLKWVGEEGEWGRLRFVASALIVICLRYWPRARACARCSKTGGNCRSRGCPGGWYSPTMVHAAKSLQAMGVHPGDSVACVGANCMHQPGVVGAGRPERAFSPRSTIRRRRCISSWPDLPNRQQGDREVGAVRVQKCWLPTSADYRVSDSDPAFRGWRPECVALSWAGLEDFISPRGRRGGGNVGIGFIDFQGLWEGRETALSFSSLPMNRHFHGLPRSA